ncbi:ribosomal RNA large subunit methyltransferase H [Gottschalkia purinilytica]|uniref:Ribosomal RNA large subunit methyltransferase H n=1 Tax=Gottschalkia purinilytica TaxID=1503 RepID=A0A0L0W828_GOTPU|nr:23S rRNA (pseudouridine(1915)-N(3))-methyltransferase RlmH [Gottschalkia purinilytica]KNF07596.1 ribosomal RNA large subunit methyltransferase H [Gottschalkia purinilytica]
MNITIASVGKIKEDFLKKGIEEYSKKISKYCNIQFIEVSDEKAPENLSKQEEEIIKNKEGEKLLNRINENTYLISLTIDGDEITSNQFSQKLEKLKEAENIDVTFVIGGSLGLSNDILKRSNYKLSFSKMTFPHQLMRLILLEQIYRLIRI